MNYEEDISIDESALDVEWLQQPILMVRYGKLAAEAERTVSKAKQDLDIIKAELDKRIRDHPDKYGIDKITEAVVLNTILGHERCKKGVVDYNDAVYEHNMARAAISALQHRKDALENLVRLYGQQYFAGPTIPRDLSKEWENNQKRQESNSKIKITRRRSN